MIHSRVYFEELYRSNNDPWGYDYHWYEARKRQICLALLTRPHYERVLEIGCSNGHLSVYLAQRAAHLLCIDVSKQAVQLASQRLEAFEHVTVENRKIPEDFYEQKFDLIVISEVAYYLTFDELGEFIEQLKQALNPEGEILGTVAKLAMRQPFVLFKGLTFQKLCLPGAFRPGDHHNKMLRPGLCVVHASPQYL